MISLGNPTEVDLVCFHFNLKHYKVIFVPQSTAHEIF